MNSFIEQALRKYVIEHLNADEFTVGEGESSFDVQAAEINGVKVSIHVNIADDRLPLGMANIIIGVTSVDKVVETLHTATVVMGVSTPHDTSGYSVETHRAVSAAFRALFPDIMAKRNALAKAQRAGDVDQIADAHAKLTAAEELHASLVECLYSEASLSASDVNCYHCSSIKSSIGKPEGSTLARWSDSFEMKLAVQEED